jgi:hypothetical protein
MRTSYNLKDDAGPSTPSKKSRIIPSESDALKGMFCHQKGPRLSHRSFQSRQMPSSTPYCIQRSLRQNTIVPRRPRVPRRRLPRQVHPRPHPPVAASLPTTRPPPPLPPPPPVASIQPPILHTP